MLSRKFDEMPIERRGRQGVEKQTINNLALIGGGTEGHVHANYLVEYNCNTGAITPTWIVLS
jgi:hypothetical protein